MQSIDQDRVRAILSAEHSFYGSHRVTIRQDNRWHPGAGNLIAAQFLPTMHILDIGCGNGQTLLEHSARFETGLGIDHDPKHIQMAQAAKAAQGVKNVEFLILDFPREFKQLPPESFDIVFSQRGPIDDTSASIEAALNLLRPHGLLFCELIGERHHQEAREFFEYPSSSSQTIRKVEQVRAAMESNGVSIRLAADIVTKWYYPDIYAWLQFQCDIWTWLGIPLPESNDPRLALFAERNTIATGEIETTHHVALVAGVKQ
jgi:SAM-dependent methyltransferase